MWGSFSLAGVTCREFERHESLQISDTEGHFCLFSTEFSPNATQILGGSNDGRVYVYNLETYVTHVCSTVLKIELGVISSTESSENIESMRTRKM